MISVIVPVYNVESYLQESVDSILKQTYKDFEIILIDDGSEDLSGKICDKYAALDSRVKVIHTINQGQGAARNSGLSLAQGEYIAFVDSDDVVHPDYLKEMYRLAKDNLADIVCCDSIKGTNPKFEPNPDKKLIIRTGGIFLTKCI